jgi:hypothetical protein
VVARRGDFAANGSAGSASREGACIVCVDRVSWARACEALAVTFRFWSRPFLALGQRHRCFAGTVPGRGPFCLGVPDGGTRTETVCEVRSRNAASGGQGVGLSALLPEAASREEAYTLGGGAAGAVGARSRGKARMAGEDGGATTARDGAREEGTRATGEGAEAGPVEAERSVARRGRGAPQGAASGLEVEQPGEGAAEGP